MEMRFKPAKARGAAVLEELKKASDAGNQATRLLLYILCRH